MVRSLASSDSSDSDAASLSSLSRDSSVGSEGAVARRARADQLNAERHRENAKQWFKRRLVAILCEMALVDQLQEDGRSYRQVSGRISWFTRQCQGQSLDGLLQLARPQLVPARAEGLLRDAQLLQRLCDETIPPNDHTWIYSDQVGNSDSPARHRVEQRTQLLLQQSLAPRLRTKEPTTFIQRAITTAGGNFYRDFIFLVWPLFTDQDRLEFQTWYYNHDGAGVPPDVPEHVPSSSSGIRREQCAAVPRGLLNEPRSVIGRKALNTGGVMIMINKSIATVEQIRYAELVAGGQRAATFLMPKGHGVQIDFLLTRLPCSNVSRQVKEALLRHPHLTAQYQQAAAQSLQQRKDRTIDACLADAWRQCTKCLGRIRPLPPAQQELSLRAFWFAKRHLRYCQTLVTHYNAPVVWYVSHSLPNRVHTLLPGSVRRLRPLIQLWRAAISFQKQDKILRQKVKERKIAKVDHLISVAQEADKRGLSTLHQLLKHLKPKAPKRSIHFRRADGQLMGIEEEMDKLRAFFSELYQADSHNPTPHFLQEALPVESWEVTAALHSMPAHKALPPGQAPARLWKLAARSVETELLRDFNAALQPGELCFPHHWHDSHLALLAKPHKPPNSPSNLRPINLLVAEAKLLARIAAEVTATGAASITTVSSIRICAGKADV
ncbi:LINE-1 retrotransposable element ORF2 protein [Symbiodinium microadriaticum]|uniref:LINE-1 retrotransposable element ORF2 protein n=1 Tax=Symbiodinium microadriaticum TaxID=2951 RepID=A0A1Q9CFM5_SYMMI|nr:LINE-1 retrotransposable element ORF2 protein [Symbiodinium microadriaticum]